MRHSLPRFAELDSLRGLAALLVVLHHAWLAVPAMRPTLNGLLKSTPLRPLAEGRPAVVFFFVLSGYVLAWALNGKGPPAWRVYAAQRSVRLGLPVFAALVFSAALQSLTWRSTLPPGSDALVATASWHAMWTPEGLVRQALLVGHNDQFQLDPVLWSLVHEWRVSLLMPVVLLFRERAVLLVAFGLGARELGMAAGAPQDAAMLGGSLGATVAATLYFLLPFAAGAAMAMAEPLPAMTRPARLVTGIAVLTLAAAGTDLATVAASVLLILLARQRESAFAEWLRRPAPTWLGRVSFSLYLVHMPVLLALTHLLLPHLAMAAIAVLATVLALPTAAVMHRLVERPAHGVARSVGQAETAERAPAVASHADRSNRRALGATAARIAGLAV